MRQLIAGNWKMHGLKAELHEIEAVACISEISPPRRTRESRLRQIIGGDFFRAVPAGE